MTVVRSSDVRVRCNTDDAEHGNNSRVECPEGKRVLWVGLRCVGGNRGTTTCNQVRDRLPVKGAERGEGGREGVAGAAAPGWAGTSPPGFAEGPPCRVHGDTLVLPKRIQSFILLKPVKIGCWSGER